MMIKYTIEYTGITWNDYIKVNQHKIFKVLLRKVCFNVKETFTMVHRVQWGHWKKFEDRGKEVRVGNMRRLCTVDWNVDLCWFCIVATGLAGWNVIGDGIWCLRLDFSDTGMDGPVKWPKGHSLEDTVWQSSVFWTHENLGKTSLRRLQFLMVDVIHEIKVRVCGSRQFWIRSKYI